MSKNKYVLITGSDGLVGSESVKYFSKLGFNILGIDNNSRKKFFGEDASFIIGNKFNFKGSVELLSDQRDLIFDGYFKLNHSCSDISREWINFRSQINVLDIVL